MSDETSNKKRKRGEEEEEEEEDTNARAASLLVTPVTPPTVQEDKKSYRLKVVLLLMGPETRRFELLQFEFDSLEALVSDVLAQIPVSVTEEALRKQSYTSICGRDGEEMTPSRLLSSFCKGNDVLVAIPSSMPAKECARRARPILNDDKVVSMLLSSGVDAKAWRENKKKESTGSNKAKVSRSAPSAYSCDGEDGGGVSAAVSKPTITPTPTPAQSEIDRWIARKCPDDVDWEGRRFADGITAEYAAFTLLDVVFGYRRPYQICDASWNTVPVRVLRLLTLWLGTEPDADDAANDEHPNRKETAKPPAAGPSSIPSADLEDDEPRDERSTSTYHEKLNPLFKEILDLGSGLSPEKQDKYVAKFRAILVEMRASVAEAKATRAEDQPPAAEKSNEESPPSSSPVVVPSPARLAAQRGAMSLFQEALVVWEKGTTYEITGRPIPVLPRYREGLERLVVANYGCESDDELRRTVLDELLVLLVVYELLGDFRRLGDSDADGLSQLDSKLNGHYPFCLPIAQPTAFSRDWWDDYARRGIIDPVPWKGRGLLANSKVHDDAKTRHVSRLRLSGNHSKLYMLTAAMACPDVVVLDLQGCVNLDEETLAAMTTRCSGARFVLLRGTPIPEGSEVVSRLRARGVVDFSGDTTAADSAVWVSPYPK